MSGKIPRIVIGLVLVAVAILLYFLLDMFWTALLCLVIGVIVLITGFVGKKQQGPTTPEPPSPEPPSPQPPSSEPPSSEPPSSKPPTV